jgi:RNA polymerase sigma-70 factor (ECF subfamily)
MDALAKVVCVVPAGIDEAAVTALERHFEPRVDVLVEARRGERRSGDRRLCDLETSGDDRRHVRNPDGRRIDDRRRELIPRPSQPLPRSLAWLGQHVAFLGPHPADRRRLEAAESLRLAVRFQLGEPDAFKLLYERHFDAVYAYLMTVLRDRHDAEDAAQEVFVKTLRALPRFEFRGHPFDAWLFRIVRNHAIDAKRRVGLVSPADPARIELWRDERDQREARDGGDDHLVALVERLPPSQRQVIVLRYMVGLDWRDVAAVVGRTSGAVRQTEQRALRSMRRRLAVDEGGASRTRPAPMVRLPVASPVASRRRSALLFAA